MWGYYPPCQLIPERPFSRWDHLTTTSRVHFVFWFSILICQVHWVLEVLIANFKKKTTIKKWKTLLTVKLTNDVIMQLSCCPLLYPISPVPSCPSLKHQVSPCFPANTSLYPPCSPCSSLSYIYILVLLSFLLGPGSWEDDERQRD